uniref:Ribosomal protein S19 n=1 Tax=Xanthoceras sorbifolium TaxID=99658 RepID=A0A2P1FUG6_9ROSI|nr:ribosomal protein S19 [Xanthoceras sorbifolium]YP_009476533.1 ribosomal protein S19 [Xanthoceras sorbifolium]AVM38962.1 ribosomal protein S19 [Xanthoceras sorbifolium]AVM38986.1 ribosomal protein S19 [Xanthoceras sorbifolium]QIM59505.1 ribosomal protein S19 [Xanthoceras sorbifolium]QIM59528.1 ribosomal protein S19 [Xanthoceras sorbifolium]QMJ95930.1 ribosomal protein S19 [Xanthoceras sorbifolium]
MTRSLKKNPFVANHLLIKIDKLNTNFYIQFSQKK